MTNRTQLLDELRSLFRDGATPSRLLQHVCSSLGDSTSYRDLCDAIQDAFHLPVVRISPSSVAHSKDHRGVVLNKTLLLEILQRKGEWDTAPSNGHARELSWMDGELDTNGVPSDDAESAPVPGLSQESWAALRPEERAAVHSLHVGSRVQSQRIDALARLAERLQEKVCELERDRTLQREPA